MICKDIVLLNSKHNEEIPQVTWHTAVFKRVSIVCNERNRQIPVFKQVSIVCDERNRQIPNRIYV